MSDEKIVITFRTWQKLRNLIDTQFIMEDHLIDECDTLRRVLDVACKTITGETNCPTLGLYDECAREEQTGKRKMWADKKKCMACWRQYFMDKAKEQSDE